MYETCVEDKGPGITKWSLSRIRDVLSDTGINSPFDSLVHDTAKLFISLDKMHIGDKVQKSVSLILDKVPASMDDSLSENKAVDEAEIAAKAQLQEVLPTILAELEQVDKDMQAVMAKYGLQPKFERSRVMVKIE